MLHAPFLAHPLGWLVLGIGGYALYQSGKKRAERENREQQAATAPVVESDPTAMDSKEEN